jgi:hypothetical protein
MQEAEKGYAGAKLIYEEYVRFELVQLGREDRDL